MTYVNIDVNINILDIQTNINSIETNGTSNRKCPVCQNVYLIKTLVFNDLLFFDTQNTYRNDPENNIAEIPSTLIIGGNEYSLKCAIQYLPGPSPDSLGHYICHVKRPNSNWEEYNDFSNSICSSPKKIKIHLLIYTKKEIKIIFKRN